MSYRDNTGDEETTRDLLTRKEFLRLRKGVGEHTPIDAFNIDHSINYGSKILPRAHQIGSSTIMNPHSPYKRHLNNFQTGSGKTKSGLEVAKAFIPVFKQLYAIAATTRGTGRAASAELDAITPSVFVFGFGGTRTAFIRDLLTDPEYGIISINEREELMRRRDNMISGNVDARTIYKDYYNMLKRRITNKRAGGFFKFYGYEEFTLRLFNSTVPLTDLEDIALSRCRNGKQTTLEEVFAEFVANGAITINESLFAMFENSLLICDEIHNTYNSNTKNSRGVAIQYLLDTVKNLHFLALTATIINNSPTEIVEVINYLADKDKKVTKRELFVNNRILRPGALEKIVSLVLNRISFLQDVDLRYYPKREIVGETVICDVGVDSLPAGSEIPYLKFIKCPMSELHYALYSRVVNESKTSEEPSEEPSEPTEDTTSEEETNNEPNDSILGAFIGGDAVEPSTAKPQEDTEITEDAMMSAEETTVVNKIPVDGYALYDIAIPNPTNPTMCLYKSSNSRNTVSSATTAQRDAIGIHLKRKFGVSVFTGSFMEHKNLKKYSTKYATLVELLIEGMRNGGDVTKYGKSMIYHERVQMSGVTMIDEILSMNGFIDESTDPTDSTLCICCGDPLNAHKNNGGDTAHEYIPARYMTIHSSLDKTSLDNNIIRFNSVSNVHGQKCAIIIGSRLIKESYEFKAVQNVFILSLPTNISTMMQVFGRSVRHMSHIDLPIHQRKVTIRILVSTVPAANAPTHTLSLELYRYIYKLLDYMTIQDIEKGYNAAALNADLYRSVIMPDSMREIYFDHSVEPKRILGNLYFEPTYTVNSLDIERVRENPNATFIAYRYMDDEINMISWIIKRLFILQPAYTYDTLWQRVKNPPFSVEINTEIFSEDAFIISLHHLCSEHDQIVNNRGSSSTMTNLQLIEHVYDYNLKYIIIGGLRHQIQHIGDYYILFPIVENSESLVNRVYTHHSEHIRDTERAMIKQQATSGWRTIIDADSFVRPIMNTVSQTHSIADFVKSSRININYLTKKNEFMQNLNDPELFTGKIPKILIMFITSDQEFQIKFLMDAITARINDELSEGNANSSILGAFGDDEQPFDETIGTNVAEAFEPQTQQQAAQTAAQTAAQPQAQPLQPQTLTLYNSLIDLIAKFDAIIYMREVRKYKDLEQQFKNGWPALSDDTPVGFAAVDACKLYDPSESKWLEINRLNINRHVVYKENDAIIGYLEMMGDGMKFKLRRPSHIIKDDIAKDASKRTVNRTVIDTRNLERGIVCATKNKFQLIEICAQLGINIKELRDQDIKIKNLCKIIFEKLLSREIHERSKRGRLAYFYSWWSVFPAKF